MAGFIYFGKCIFASHYTTSIPTATAVGTYTVWYKVEGGSNYNDTAPAKVDVTIGKATMTPTPTLQLVTMQQKTPKTAWVYGETDVVPDVTGNASGGVVTTVYSDGSSEMPTDAGTYTVWASIAATANYYGVERTNEVSFTITKAPHSDMTAAQTVTVSRNGVTDGKLDLGAYLAEATEWTVKATDGTLITAASNGGGTVLNYTAAQTAAVSSTGSVQITVTSKNYADYTLTVNFRTASAFTLRFESNGGTEIPSRILSENAAYGPLPTAEQVQRAGYIFDGWYTDAAFTAPATAETGIGSADATVYAKWNQITRTVTLDLNGHGSIPDSYEKTMADSKITYTAQDSDFTLPVLADLEGAPTYTFGGWMKNGSDPAQINVTIVVSDLEDASYTAFWVVGEKVGVVTFEKGDAETGLMGLASMDEGTVSTDSAESTAEAGQAAKNLAEVMKEVTCEQDDTGDAENTVTVAMDLKPVDDNDPAKLDDDTREAMDKIKEASGSGDEAVKDDLVNISVTQTTTNDADEVVSRKPLPDIGRVVEIPLQYNLTGRYRPQIFHYHDGAAVAFTCLASRPVNSFTNGTFYVSGSGASAIIYIYTRYFSTYSVTTTEVPAHTVMFETNGGSEIGSVTVVDQQTLTRPDNPAKDSGDVAHSYVFDGWYAASDFSTVYDFSAPVTRDMTLYAKWREIIIYTVTLHRNDGTDATENCKTDENGRIIAEPVDDISMDVRDITMRQLLESNGPDQIWIVGIEDGKMLVSRREYRETYTSNPVWTGVYSAGEALDAAIEFDGKWVLRANDVKYTLETEDQPWYFWIIPDGTLLAQHGEDETTRLTLDTGVTKVSACRGYSSNFYPEQDQGLVAAYIKDGLPYYIQYVYDTQLEAKRWLPPELLIDEEVEDFRVHRLNDYRLGFELTTAERNIWAYTGRTYVAQAVPKEQDGVSLSDKTMFLYAPWDTDLSVEYSNAISDDSLTLYIYVSKPVRYFYSWHDILSFDEESIEYSMIDGVEIGNVDGGAVITVHLKSAPKKLITTAVVNPTDSPSLQAEIVDCGYIKAPKATLTFDTTVYRRLAVQTERAGIRNTGTGFQYAGITERRLAARETLNGIRNTAAGIQYAAITDIRNSTQHEVGAFRCTDSGMNYEQVAPSPI